MRFLQENALWQFASRTWDRQANLDGIFAALQALQARQAPARETLAQKAFYADATVLCRQLETALPWWPALPAEAAAQVWPEPRQLADIVITQSKNQELNTALY